MDQLIKMCTRCGMLFLMGISFLYADNFPFKPPQNFILKPQYIALHHPIATSEVSAQLYFDQGLTFIYAFNHEAAYWSFLRAIEVDPYLSMGYWGVALALGANINMDITSERSQAAYEAIQKAIKLASNGKKVEQDYIHALARRYSNDSHADLKQLAFDYSQAMRELSNQYPDDVDAAVLFAESLLDLNPWKQWSLEGKPLKETKEAIRKLTEVLKKDPLHLGANHYFIHAVEASLHPEVALLSAERLKTLLPSSGHILHMPSHIFLLVGDYLQAARSNEAAIAADRAYIREYGLQGIYPLHYLSHNFFFLSRAYTLLGRFEEAQQAANDLIVFYSPYFTDMPELEYYASALLTVFINFHQWKKIVEMPKPKEDMQLTVVLWHFGRAIAFAHLGQISEAIQEQRLFLEGKAKLSKEQLFGYNKADQVLTIADHCLRAKLAEVQGEPVQAIHFLQEAVKEQDSLYYNEPPDWFFPVRETLGSVLLRLQKPVEAEIVLREELKRHPRNGRALFELLKSLKAQSKSYDFYWVNQEFQQAWKYSSLNL